jgi:hypothetical protein
MCDYRWDLDNYIFWPHTLRNYNIIADLHKLKITSAHAKTFPVCSVFIRGFLVTVSNSGYLLPCSSPLWTVTLNWNIELLRALASTVVLGFGPCQDPWPYFFSFQTFTCFEMGPPVCREEGSDYYWSLPPLLGIDSAGAHSHSLIHSLLPNCSSESELLYD